MMTISRIASNQGIFQPEELNILQRVFDQMCIERGCLPDSKDGEALAMELVALFQNGIMTENDLFGAVEGNRRSA
jgi:hypothetical protein